MLEIHLKIRDKALMSDKNRQKRSLEIVNLGHFGYSILLQRLKRWY